MRYSKETSLTNFYVDQFNEEINKVLFEIVKLKIGKT